MHNIMQLLFSLHGKRDEPTINWTYAAATQPRARLGGMYSHSLLDSILSSSLACQKQ